MGCEQSKQQSFTDSRATRKTPFPASKNSLAKVLAEDREGFSAGVAAIRDGVIGEHFVFPSPLPLKTKARRVLYTDYTASGRALESVERYMLDKVLPLYANTHTMTSATGRQTTLFRDEARTAIKKYYNCNDENLLIFAGSGATGGAAVFMNLVQLTGGFTRDQTAELYEGCTIIVDAVSHHSSILPYRELEAEQQEGSCFYETKVVHCDLQTAHLCVNHLKKLVSEASARRRKVIAVLCAASNVTGIFPNCGAINEMVHEHGGVVFWDAAGLAAHRPFDMNPAPSSAGKDASTDFLIASPHKLVGGPGSPGIFLLRKKYMTTSRPTMPGGGTVTYVDRQTQTYTTNLEEREEAGTPNILGSIRAGLAYLIHDNLGKTHIAELELKQVRKLIAGITRHRNVEVLGPVDKDRVGIVAFNIRYNLDIYLHYNFVSVLLNDVFGIQVRGGCACAGPYAQWLMTMDDATVTAEHDLIRDTDYGLLRSGFVRTGVHFTMTDEDVDFVVQAILWVAENGWKLLGAYKWDLSGFWQVRNPSGQLPLSLASMEEQYSEDASTNMKAASPKEALADASELLTRIYTPGNVSLESVAADKLPEKYYAHAGFALPSDFMYAIRSQGVSGSTATSLAGLKPLTAPSLDYITRQASSGLRRCGGDATCIACDDDTCRKMRIPLDNLSTEPFAPAVTA